MISGREAVRRITATGVGERQARRVLACGAAGRATHAGSCHLYDEATVDALVGRPLLDPRSLVDELGCEVLVTRRAFDVTAEPEEQRRELSAGWRMSPWTAVLVLQLRADQHGSLPLVGTVAGFVLGGADLVGVGGSGDGRIRFRLREPGPWFDRLAGSRLHCGHGRDWVLLEPVPGSRRVRGELAL